jgi:hypothetical protein
MLKLETLDDHIFDQEPTLKQSWVCPSGCAASGVCWSDDGEAYGPVSNIDWIDDNSAAFGSFQRKLNVEIYKKDENFRLCVLPWPMRDWKVNVKYRYVANEDGEILSKKWYLEWVRPRY